MSPCTSNFLNASRWVAAFFVVIGHVYNISISYHSVVHPSFLVRGVHFFSGFGHIAVIVFFVISGFLVGGRTILSSQDKRFGVIDYFIHRFSRIYTVLIPALVVGFILDRLGIEFFNASGIYNHPEEFYTNSFGNDIAKHLSFNTFIGNLTQLQEIIVPSLGSNGPLWSLANEWWYYVLFGLCMIVYRPGRMLTRVVACGAIVAIIMVLPLSISLWFVVWGVGVGVAVLDRHWSGWPFFAGAAIAVVCFGAVRWTVHRGVVSEDLSMGFAMDLAVALGYSAMLVCAKNLKRPGKFWLIHRGLASFSYTVYLVHFPAMVFVAAFMKSVLDIGFGRQPTVAAMIYAGALLVILYGYAWIVAAFTEVHTNAVRSRLSTVIPAVLYRTAFLIHRQIYDHLFLKQFRFGSSPTDGNQRFSP
jgi:peptidoglycan/LPS O-acetylase OafA/YrhL